MAIPHIIFITENTEHFKELELYISSNGINISIEMIKSCGELYEIQSMDRYTIVLKKLHDTVSLSKELISHNKYDNSNSDVWIMVDNTSLSIAKMGGFPGSFIKYYLQSIPLLEIADSNWGSAAMSYVSFAIGKYDFVARDVIYGVMFEDCVEGVIVEPRGRNGVGFDSIFKPSGNNNYTVAEMSVSTKVQFSPRIKAFNKIVNYLQ